MHNGTLDRLNPSFAEADYGRSIGISNSNLGALAVSRHFSKGWSAHAIYTYGKSLDLTSNNDNGVDGDRSAEAILDAQTLADQYGRSDYDSRQRFSVDAVWNPREASKGLLGLVASGWTLSPVIILQSGQAFTVYTSAPFYQGGDYNGDGWDFDIPNVPSFGRHISSRRSDFLKGLFKASDFPAPATGTEGNLGRNTFDGPGFANVNLTVQKTFGLPKLGEGGGLELRGEFINLFNRVNLTKPVSDLYSTQFGYSTSQDSPRDIQVSAHIRF